MNFLITYNVVLDNEILYDKQIKVKNKSSEFIAKCSLEDYLKKKHGDLFRQLIITNCSQDTEITVDDIFRIFNGFN